MPKKTGYTIRDYCFEKGLSLSMFSKITGLSAVYVYEINNNRDANITLDIMLKIFNGTKLEFGKGLLPSEYLNMPQ